MLPSTSVKTSGSDKHKKKSKSSKKSALPATGPVDGESKISSDTTIQPVVPGPGTQSTQPTYAEVVKTSQNSAATDSTISTSDFTGSTSDCTGSTGFTCSSSVTSQISSLPALTSTSVQKRPESGPDESDRDDEPLFGVDIPVSGEEGAIYVWIRGRLVRT